MALPSKTKRRLTARPGVAAFALILLGPPGLFAWQSAAAPGPVLIQPAQKSGYFGEPAKSTGNPPPPREVPLVEMRLEALSNQSISEEGKKALEINPGKWKHAETANFILHYRRATEAQKVVREVEYDLWYVAGVLGAGRDRYTQKSHVYVFEDADEWKQFLKVSNNPMQWAASYARGDELFLNVRGGGNSGGGFDSKTLAHETTHAVVARLYPNQRFPLWLNEGFAEYMGGASVAARKGQTVKRFQGRLEATMPLRVLESLNTYPSDEAGIRQLYQTSEKFVRFLMNEMPKDRITQFIGLSLAGKGMQEAFLAVYSDQCKDWPTFEKRFERFSK